MANPPLYSPIKPHFFQPLLPGFTNHLDIPVAFFLKHLEGSNKGKTAKLRSDASEITWKVKIDGRRLSVGWEDFAVAHDLRIGDIVVFRHEGDLLFHVTALGPSCCEIQYGEYSNDEEENMEKVSRKKKKSPKTETDDATDQSCFEVTVTASNLKRDVVYLPKTFAEVNGLIKKSEIVLMNEEGESWKIDLRHEDYSGRFYMSRGWRSFCVANGKKPGDDFTFKLVQNEETPVIQMLPLNTEDLHKLDSTMDAEKVPKKKCQKTEADSSPDHSCFVAIVTASNLERDTVYLPKKFAVSNGLLKKREIDLVNEKGKSWRIDLRHVAYPGRFCMRRGWRSFCIANEKKPGDSFKFKLVQNGETPMLQMFPLNMHKLEPSNDTREGLEATSDVIRQGKRSKAIKTTITEEHSTTSQNRFVTLTFTPANRLNFPLQFTKENGIKKAGRITMLDRYGTRWKTSLLMNKNQRGTMSLGRNWKGFCEINGVKMDESFVLELVWEERVPILKFCSKS
ncbi:B3 domain-containing protein REM10 [Eutrema salsugineum]|uniref:B3 domain-containing protein REM10 n=1 Tax=Eutrema salsugineum TaxID=72664 RepID=UPI000CED7161|nr:B3 domain-containing protein REM10 [Eutrema salsugineum]